MKQDGEDGEERVIKITCISTRFYDMENRLDIQ